MGKTLVILVLLVAIVVLSVVLLRTYRAQQEALTQPKAGVGTPKERRHWLIGLSGEVEGKTFHIGQRTATMGRAGSNFVQIAHADASRVHCQLMARSGKLEVTDMESRNKTLVNNDPIKVRLLQDGDLLTVANCIFEYKEVGNFDKNDAFARKVVDSSSVRPTVMGMDDAPIEELVMKALAKTGGDVIKAAQLTRLQVHVVEKYAKRREARR